MANRFLTQKEAEAIRSRVAGFHRIALSELSIQEWINTHKGKERMRLLVKHFPHGYRYSTMELCVTKPNGQTIEASADFDEKKKTLADFKDYFNGLVFPIKRVKRPAADDPDGKEKELSIQEMEKENQTLRMEVKKLQKDLSGVRRLLKER